MQGQKRTNIVIHEIGPEKRVNCNQLISPIQLLNHKITCLGIINQEQKNSDQKQEQFIQQIVIDQKPLEQLNQTNQYQFNPIQQQIQIQKIDGPTQLKQPFQSKVEQKESNIKQEQLEYKVNLQIYQNDQKNKHSLIQQNHIEPNKQYNEQGQQIINQEAFINTIQTQAQQVLNQQQYQYPNLFEDNQQQMHNLDPYFNIHQQKHLKIQQLNQVEFHQIFALKQAEQSIIEKQEQIKNNQNHKICQNAIVNQHNSEEKKEENQQFKEANQVKDQQNLNYDQIKPFKSQEQLFLNHQQLCQNLYQYPLNQFKDQSYLHQSKKPKIVEVQQYIQTQKQNQRDYELQKQQFKQQQQQLQQQQQQKQSAISKEQYRIINKIQFEESKNNQDNIANKRNPQKQKKQSNQAQIIVQQQQQKEHQQNRRQVENRNTGRNRAISDNSDRKQFEFKPGMSITDQQVNQMTPEEIYEYFTQLDLENQVGLKSKIFVLENKRVQVNVTDNCAICLEEIQPQKEPIDIRLDCNHQFHYDCIKKWLLKSKQCPVCKDYVICATQKNAK
ncbi:unnamed protein product [Paramecium pentaurelia]|uniref:RING-type domain-containing protein n=1 Tax=Paramecium pentaurelia TaxID=43138 RepID=A0A8S1TLZ7_9CILI|nr:unnamed protein product [Paramecium pentaurelia]